MIIATAGHVDHGKTTLLRVLTGTDADRLPEEKRRGMTIDLGYAYLPLTNGQILGFIDVPGHEKFLTNMLAGVGGIQHALLVVAADDGVMPQTREHLAILDLLGVPALTVVFTKIDRVSSNRITEVRQQIRQQLAHHHWQQVSEFMTSSIQGAGIEELRQHLTTLTSQQQQPITDQRFRLAIDRKFTIKGSGLVVTGTALAGQVKVEDKIWLTGINQWVRIKQLHAQNTAVNIAGRGERIALNITGNFDKNQIARGDWLLAEQPTHAVDRVLAILYNNQPIQHWQPVHLHHATSHITGRISQLQQGYILANQNTLIELLLDEPLFLAENDRFIIRDISAKKTLGSARVIHLTPPKRGKRQPSYLAQLKQWANAPIGHQGDQQILKLKLLENTLSLSQFAWARQLSASGLQSLLMYFDGIVIDHIAINKSMAITYQQKLLDTLAQFHQRHGYDQLGVGRASLKRMALPAEPESVIFNLLDQLVKTGQLYNTQGWLHLPEHQFDFMPQEKVIWQQIAHQFTDQPIWVKDLATTTHIEEPIIREVLRKSAKLGLTIAIVNDRYYTSTRIRQFADFIRTMHLKQDSVNAAEFRDQLGIGRKLAIQILEFFDRSGFTRRKGNQHLLRDNSLFLD